MNGLLKELNAKKYDDVKLDYINELF